MTLRKRNIFRPRKIISKATTLSRLLKAITAEICNSLLKLATPKSYIMRPISKRRSKPTSKLCWVLPPKQKSPSYDWINIRQYVIFMQIIFEGRWSVNFWALGKYLPKVRLNHIGSASSMSIQSFLNSSRLLPFGQSGWLPGFLSRACNKIARFLYLLRFSILNYISSWPRLESVDKVR